MTTLLPGQAAAPAGPADMRMMYVIHHAFRRDLARFAEAARLTPVEDKSTWRALSRRWQLFSVLLHDHHAKEDLVLWPLLRERATAASDSHAISVLDAMEAEHHQIDPLLERIDGWLRRQVIRPTTSNRRAMAAEVAQAATVLTAHLGHEETDAIALLQHYIDGPEWADLERRKLRGGLSPRMALKMLPWVAHDLPDPVLEPLLTEAGAGFRMMLRIGGPSFRRLEAAAFWHVPPGVGAAHR